MPLRFDEFYSRACEACGVKTQMDLASVLGINRSAITQAKKRDAVPEKWLLILSRKFAVSPDWLEHGDKFVKSMKLASESNGAKPLRFQESHSSDFVDVLTIPKISAVLCAGGGSFETDTTVVAHIPMPQAHRLGNPANLVFMDVAGDSMEPGIANGDTVLIDRSRTDFTHGSIMAVGHDDTIFLKRLKRYGDESVALLSDNPAYSPIHLYGDELNSLRIIGRLVWLCRKVN
ncbi:helix-turn-helix domain-containing protein [Desulfovibrio sp. OttesenSCG-928-C14]|nr:helix-turn-helix domain-containing protein [Desulfovibrio sp. OttesenSCG-928-C14]